MSTDQEFREFSFPECWNNKAKMQVLFSTFRPRHLNSEDYDIKMKFWKDLITQYCEFRGKVCISLRELQLQFIRGDKLPACLETVLEELRREKHLRLRSEFEYDPVNSWSGWLLNSLVKRPLSWSWGKLKHSIIAEDLEAASMVEWIHLLVLKNLCLNIEEKVLQPNRGKLLHLQSFRTLCQACHLCIQTDKDLFVCLLSLHASRLVGLEFKIEKQTRCIHLIKIPAKDTDDLNITEADHAVHNLQMTQASLLQQLENLEEEITLNDQKARQYVKDNKRQMAKTYLRKRILLEKNHEKRSVALHNIESLLSSVDEAQNSGVVLDAYKIGTKTLQKVLNDSGLKYDNVDEVLADVRDTLDQHREVQDVMSNSIIDEIQDEDELEKELRGILGEPTELNVNNNAKTELVITDDEMIAMLESLDVEEGSISQQSSQLSKKTVEM